MNYKRRYIYHGIKILSFLVILFVGMVLGAIFTLRPKYSEIEKRKLQELPKPQLAEMWKGQYFSELSTWYADTYPFRENLIEANGMFDSLYGFQTEQITGSAVVADDIPEVGESGYVPEDSANPTTDVDDSQATDEGEVRNQDGNQDSNQETTQEENKDNSQTDSNDETEPSVDVAENNEETISKKDINNGQTFGSIYVTKERAFSLYYFSLSAANAYAKSINKIAKELEGVANVYDLLAPTSVAIYLDDEKSKMIGTSDQKAAFEYIHSKLGNRVKIVDAFDNIKSHNEEYLYYRTDHHWTALGAYYAYEKFCESKGITPNPLSSFEKREYPGFLGSFYAATDQSSAVKKNTDTIEAYVPKGTNTMTYTDKDGKEYKWPIVNDVSKYKDNAKYSTFVAGDNPYSVITNENSASNESCVVVKESYGNAMIPFLVDHYKNIYIVDYRYYKGNLIDLVKKKKINDVVFINNAEAINNTVVSLIDKIS